MSRCLTPGRLWLPALAVLCALLLSACGGSSSSTAASPSTSAATGATGAGPGRFAALRACLQKQGVTLPARRRGGGPRPGGPPAGGGLFGARRGATGAGGFADPKLRAALAKCGAGAGFRGGPRTSRPAFRAAVSAFTACVRRNGYPLPAPNLSGTGPVFDPSKVHQHDRRFVTASARCQSLLRSGFGGGPAAPPAAAGVTQ